MRETLGRRDFVRHARGLKDFPLNSNCPAPSTIESSFSHDPRSLGFCKMGQPLFRSGGRLKPNVRPNAPSWVVEGIPPNLGGSSILLGDGTIPDCA